MSRPDPLDLDLNPVHPPLRGDPPPPRRVSRWFLVGATLLLALPAGIPSLAHWLYRANGLVPTGFAYYDFPIYLAKGREHFDPGAFGWTYSQPCSDQYDAPRIYAQPWTLALGAVHHATGLRPGVVYTGFGASMALFGAGAAVALYGAVVGLDTPSRRVGLLLFGWGGGLLVVAGAVLGLVRHEPLRATALFQLDPGQGRWFLNFGRNLIFPTEALYHGLTFLALLAVIRRRLILAWVLALLTAACSPFAGAGLLATLGVWGALETGFLRNRERTAGFLVATCALIGAFAGYYLVFLNRFAEHRQIAEQMEFAVEYNAESFVPALVLVAGLAAWTLRDSGRAARHLAEPGNRLLLVWAVVSFALAQHEFALKPRQPIHFDRGYPWVALFLLGAPALVALVDGVRRLPRLLAWPLLASLVLVGVSDNVAWFAQFPLKVVTGRFGTYELGFHVTADQAAVLRALDDRQFYGDLVLSDDPDLAYLTIAETPLRSWYSHIFETRDHAQREREVADLLRSGAFLPAWEGRPLLVVARDAAAPMPAWVARRGGRAVYRNGSFVVYRIAGQPAG